MEHPVIPRCCWSVRALSPAIVEIISITWIASQHKKPVNICFVNIYNTKPIACWIKSHVSRRNSLIKLVWKYSMNFDTLSLPHSKENPGKCQPDLLLVGPSHSLQGPSHKLYRTNLLKFTFRIRDLIIHFFSQIEMLIWNQCRIYKTKFDPLLARFYSFSCSFQENYNHVRTVYFRNIEAPTTTVKKCSVGA